jgi:hypothetical protein
MTKKQKDVLSAQRNRMKEDGFFDGRFRKKVFESKKYKKPKYKKELEV